MSPNEETMKVAVRCKHCGRLICYKMGTATGYVEMKCSKCGQKVLVNLALRKRSSRVSYRRVANVSLYLPPITIQYTKRGAFDFQVNLLLMSQKLKYETGNGVLMDSNYYIIDEAHKLVEAADSVYGAQITPATIPDFLRSAKYTCGKDKVVRKVYQELCQSVLKLNEELFLKLEMKLDDMDDERCSVELNEEMQSAIASIAARLKQICKFQTDERKARRGSSLVETLMMFTRTSENLCWLELDKSTNTSSLCCVPITMKESLNRNLWTVPNTHWVLTSGTMQDDTGFAYFKDELGIRGNVSDSAILEHSNGSPFDYKNHTRLYISENVPTPDMNNPKYMGSLFDGIGGFPLAAVHCGIRPVWASEIEAFPIEVTKIRFPDMFHVGDITKLNGAELPPVDIICGGSP